MAASCQSCHTKCGKGRVSPEVLQKLECGFYNLESSDSNSLLRRHLTRCVFDKLKFLVTPAGGTLLDCIQSGLVNHDSGVGVYAPDPQAYVIFADLFDPIIEEYHMGFRKNHCHPQTNFGDMSSLVDLDPTGNFIISTRVRCGRAIEGFPFNPLLTEHQYCDIEKRVCEALCQTMTCELKGRYYPLCGMEKSVQQQLITDHYLFKEGDRFLQAANATRFWPRGRGIFYNENKTFLVWCNEEDHLRIISMQSGGNLGEIYKRMADGVQALEKRLRFVRSDHLGYLTFCPTNLGTTIRASVHIKLPKLAADLGKLEELANQYHLQVRGTQGEHSAAPDGIYDISNKRRLGLTEYEAVKEMQDGILELIKQEAEMK